MPSEQHEVPIALAHDDPALLVRLLRARGFTADDDVLARCHIRPASESVQVAKPTTLAPDCVTVIEHNTTPILSIVFEVQRRYDPHKLLIWPTYLAFLQHRHQAPARLLVLCPDPRVARRYEHELTQLTQPTPPHNLVGTDLPLQATFITRDHLTLPTSTDMVLADPAAATLAILTHPHPPRDALTHVLNALATLGKDTALSYDGHIERGLSAPARREWRNLVSTSFITQWHSEEARAAARRALEEGRAEGLTEGLSEGLSRGRAASVLAVLDARDITLTQARREQILTTTDLDLLDRWLTRAATATTIDDVLA